MQLKIFTCTTLLVHAQKRALIKKTLEQIAKYKKHSDLIPWKFVEMSNFFEFLIILKFVTKKLHAQCACRLENLLAQRKKCMHFCKCACVKSSTACHPIWVLSLIWDLTHSMIVFEYQKCCYSNLQCRFKYSNWDGYMDWVHYLIYTLVCMVIRNCSPHQLVYHPLILWVVDVHSLRINPNWLTIADVHRHPSKKKGEKKKRKKERKKNQMTFVK